MRRKAISTVVMVGGESHCSANFFINVLSVSVGDGKRTRDLESLTTLIIFFLTLYKCMLLDESFRSIFFGLYDFEPCDNSMRKCYSFVLV